MKIKYQHAFIVFGIIFSILAVVMYVAGLVAADINIFWIGIGFQIIGAVMIGIAKKEHNKSKIIQ